MTDQEIILKVKAETDKATAEIKRLNKEVSNLEKQVNKGGTKKLSSSFNSVSKSATSLTTSLKGVVGGLSALGIGMKAVEFAKMAADAEQAGDAFDKVVTDMGKNADEEFAKIKEASKGLISETDIKQSATTALSLGVPLESLAQLMEVARAKSREMGTDVKSAFADLATGIGRGSPMILDNLGLTIKLGDANQKMASSLGKTAGQLTKQEKTQALTNAVIDAGSESVKRYADAQLSSKEKMQAMNASVDDLKVKLGTALLPMLDKATTAITKWADSIDEEDMNRFSTELDVVVDAIGGVWEAAKLLNDVLMPDWLGGEDSGFLDTAVKGWDAIGDRLVRIKEITDSMDAFASIGGEIKSVNEEISTFDGGADGYEKLSEKVIGLYERLQDLKKTFQQSGSDEAKAQVKALDVVIGDLEKSIDKLSKKKPFDAFEEGAKDAVAATKKYSAAQLKEIGKVNDARIKSSGRLVGKLEKNEAKLTSDIAKLHRKLAAELKKIDQERFSTNLDIDQKIKDIGYSQLNETAAYYAKQKDAAAALSKAKEALYAGELEKYKEYIAQYEDLATESAGHAIEKNGAVLVSQKETSRAGIAALNNVKQLENQYYDQKAQRAKAAHDAAVAQKQVELDAIKAQLEAQKALLEASKELAEALTGKKVDIDTSVIDASIAKIDALKQKAAEIGTQPPAFVGVDTHQVEAASQKVEQLKTLTLNGVTLNVDANTTPADFGINRIITDSSGKTVTMKVNADYAVAKKQIEDVQNGVQKKPVVAKVDADTRLYKKKIATLGSSAKQKTVVPVDADTQSATQKVVSLRAEAKKQIIVALRFNPDTKAADRARGNVSQPITVPVTYVPTNSPPPGTSPGFESGGYTGAGANTDVAGVVHKNEFVLPAPVVKNIGVGKLYNMMHSFKIPKLPVPGYANGGLVGSNNTSIASPQMQPINLNIGNKTFQVMSDSEVAAALTRYIDTEGGM